VSPPFVIFGVYLGVLDQPLDLFFAEPARCSDFDRLFFVRAQVLGRDVLNLELPQVRALFGNL